MLLSAARFAVVYFAMNNMPLHQKNLLLKAVI